MFNDYCIDENCFSTYRMILYDTSYNLLFDLYILHSDDHVIKCRFINNLNKYISEQSIFEFFKSSVVHDDIVVDLWHFDDALDKIDNLHINITFMLILFNLSILNIENNNIYLEVIDELSSISNNNYTDKDNEESFYNKNYKFVENLTHLYVFE